MDSIDYSLIFGIFLTGIILGIIISYTITVSYFEKYITKLKKEIRKANLTIFKLYDILECEEEYKDIDETINEFLNESITEEDI